MDTDTGEEKRTGEVPTYLDSFKSWFGVCSAALKCLPVA